MIVVSHPKYSEVQGSHGVTDAGMEGTRTTLICVLPSLAFFLPVLPSSTSAAGKVFKMGLTRTALEADQQHRYFTALLT